MMNICYFAVDVSADAPSRQLDYLLPNTTLATRLVDGSMHVAQPLPPDSMAATSDHLPVAASFVRQAP